MAEQEVQEYSRQALRKATRFVEGDYKGINPREFYRRLKRRLEEIQTKNDFKYVTRGTQRGDLQIISETVGEKTGRLEGRLVAQSDWAFLGDGKLEYRPYGPHGAMAIVVGALLAGVGAFAEEIAAAVFGIAVTAVGIYFYFQKETGSFPVAQRDIIRVLITGEVSEREIEDTSERRTDIFANMTVIYAGDTFVNVYTKSLGSRLAEKTTEFEELPWTLRYELVRQVKRWHDQIVVEEQRFEPDSGLEFFSQLSALSDRDADSHRQSIDNIQEAINRSFDIRMEYNDLLLKQLSQEAQSIVEQQIQEVDDELQELADDMDVYVEREGLKHTT